MKLEVEIAQPQISVSPMNPSPKNTSTFLTTSPDLTLFKQPSKTEKKGTPLLGFGRKMSGTPALPKPAPMVTQTLNNSPLN